MQAVRHGVFENLGGLLAFWKKHGTIRKCVHTMVGKSLEMCFRIWENEKIKRIE